MMVAAIGAKLLAKRVTARGTALNASMTTIVPPSEHPNALACIALGTQVRILATTHMNMECVGVTKKNGAGCITAFIMETVQA